LDYIFPNIFLLQAHDHGEDEHDHDEDEHDHGDEDHDEHDHDSDSSSSSEDEDHDDHDHDEDHDEDEHDHDEDHDHEDSSSEDEDHDDHDHDEDEHDHEDSSSEHEDEDHDDHDHDEDEHHDEDEDHEHEEKQWISKAVEATGDCIEDYELFDIYDVNSDGDLDSEELSPAMHELLLMIFNECGEEDSHDDENECKQPETWESWVYAFLATLIISLASLLGVIIIPVRIKLFKKVLLEVLVAFGVGALLGSAILELIPAAFELHQHGAEEGGDSHDHGSEEEEDHRNYLWGGAAVLAGLVFFFILEKIITFALVYALKIWDKYHPKSEDDDLELGEDQQKEMGGHSHGVDLFSGGKKRLKAVGILNLITDGVHNLIDGIAIGVAWKTDLGTGLATSLAILFHEIPQEFGDFAILLYAGFKKWQALLFNLFSALIAFLGTLIGLLIGTAAQDADRWILAITAGGFIYIALVDMLAEIKEIKGIFHSIAQVLAILTGMAIMFIIAIFEDDLGGCYAH